jgi:hypothetical protein
MSIHDREWIFLCALMAGMLGSGDGLLMSLGLVLAVILAIILVIRIRRRRVIHDDD